MNKCIPNRPKKTDSTEKNIHFLTQNQLQFTLTDVHVLDQCCVYPLHQNLIYAY